MRTAMPSPNRTNIEKLYLPLRLANDAARRRAADASPSSEAMSNLMAFLNDRLSPDDQREVEGLLSSLLEAMPDADTDTDQAQDRRRRAWTGDRQANTMAARFPNARRIREII